MDQNADQITEELSVTHDEEGNRYLLEHSGKTVGLIDYRVDGDTLDFVHTEIAPPARGRGLGGVLVREALDDVRQGNRRVTPSCWYVREFIGANPDYADLVATPRP